MAEIDIDDIEIGTLVRVILKPPYRGEPTGELDKVTATHVMLVANRGTKDEKRTSSDRRTIDRIEVVPEEGEAGG